MVSPQVSSHRPPLLVDRSITADRLPRRLACRSNQNFEGLAWPANSQMDIQASRMLREMNIPTYAGLVQVFQEWKEAHAYSLWLISEALLAIQRFPRSEVEKRGREGWRVAFMLSAGTTDPDRRTPMNAFKIDSCGLKYGSPNSAVARQDRYNLDQSARRAREDGVTIPCMFPAEFYMRDTFMCQWGTVVIQHFRSSDRNPAEDALAQVGFGDVVKYLQATINTGKLSWRPTNEGPCPMKFVWKSRARKKWDLEPLCADIVEAEQLANERVGYKFVTGLSLLLLLVALYR